MWNASSTNITSTSHFFHSTSSFFVHLSCAILKSLLIFPLSILVLYVGFRRWRRQEAPTHFDVFTVHMALIELTSAVGNTVYYRGLSTGVLEMIKWGLSTSSMVYPGETLIHCLTCVDRYLAVVHPITYMRLRQRGGGVRIRNISISSVWIFNFGFVWLTAHNFPRPPSTHIYCMLTISFIIISFCSLSVLFVLIRPGPGGGARGRVDRSKQKAFHTIMAVLGVLLSWLLAVLVTLCVLTNPLLSHIEKSVAFDLLPWFNIPSSLVLPVLFLQRARKRLCCQGQG